LRKDLTNKRFSSKVIEMKNNSNFSNSIINSTNRKAIMERYFEK